MICSDARPIAVADLGDFGQTFEAPTLGPLAQEFASSTASWLDVLNGAYTILELEAALDAGGAIASAVDLGTAGDTTASLNAAFDQVAAAVDGFAASRAQLEELVRFLPPEAQGVDQIHVEPPSRLPGAGGTPPPSTVIHLE